MSTTIIPNSSTSQNQRKTFWLDKLAKTGLFKRLEKLQYGSLSIRDQDETFNFGNDDSSYPSVNITVKNSRFYSAIAFGGSVGAGEAYFYNYWDCDDLTSLVRLLLINREVLDGMDESLSRLQAPLFNAIHWLNRNTREGSRRNIAAHYDLGNEMFELFLDSNMMYSSAIYPSEESTLEQASAHKLDRICQKLQLTENDHVLEIGTGWGGFALHAAKHYGCKVTTTTISKQQYGLAYKRVQEAGLQDKITLLLNDYRDLEGQYDKLVSIEMIEAIGHQYINTYFQKCSELLKPNGAMLIQAITIADQRYKLALKEVDFIKRYIFPGCFIPSNTAMQNAITESTDMRIYGLEDIGLHYARTLNDWRKRFFTNIEQVKALGYPDEFVRLWEFYLCYCEGGFKERAISNVQLVIVKPENSINYPT